MIRGARRTAALALAITASLLFVGGVGLVRGGSASPSTVHTAAGAESLTVTVGTAFAFNPSTFEVTPGDQVTLTLENLDTLQHTFTLSSVANYTFSSSNTTSDLQAFFNSHAPIEDVTIQGSAGFTQKVTFTAPAKGVYEFVCLVPGHFQAGMWGLMGSGVAVGPPPAPGIPVGLYLITGGIVSLVILAIVLGFIVGQREGSRYEMPPERLGYAEPTTPTGERRGPPPPFSGH